MRVIDADRLKRKVQRIATEAWMMKINASVETTLNQFIDYLDEAPTIEPKRGEWIWKSDKDYSSPSWTCSECGLRKVNKYNFCPNCGADMREREGE